MRRLLKALQSNSQMFKLASEFKFYTKYTEKDHHRNLRPAIENEKISIPCRRVKTSFLLATIDVPKSYRNH